MDKKSHIEELGYSDDLSNAPKIAAYLEDGDREIVAWASFHLGALKSRDHIGELADLLNSPSDQVVNMACAGLNAMVNESDAGILPKAHPILKHKFKLARLSAIETIGKIGSKESLPYLLNVFSNAGSGERGRIVQSLGAIGSRDALPLLRDYLVEVQGKDHSQSNRGGTRGADLHPKVLQSMIENAIDKIERNRV